MLRVQWHVRLSHLCTALKSMDEIRCRLADTHVATKSSSILRCVIGLVISLYIRLFTTQVVPVSYTHLTLPTILRV